MSDQQDLAAGDFSSRMIEMDGAIRGQRASDVPCDGRCRHEAVRAAATFLREHSGLLPTRMVPTNPTQLAVLALRVHEIFLRRDGDWVSGR